MLTLERHKKIYRLWWKLVELKNELDNIAFVLETNRLIISEDDYIKVCAKRAKTALEHSMALVEELK